MQSHSGDPDTLAHDMEMMGLGNNAHRTTHDTEGRAIIESTQEIMALAEETVAACKAVINVVESHEAVDTLAPKLGLLGTHTRQIAGAVPLLEHASSDYISLMITQAAKQDPESMKLLQEFASQLTLIIRDSLSKFHGERNCWQRILESCYSQALDFDGKLHIDQYFIRVEEASLERPYDPDFESEAYYEHQYRLEIDESYASAERQRQDRTEKEWKSHKIDAHHHWVGFWYHLLNGCLDGLTLFWPLPEQEMYQNLPPVPPLLFRTYDSQSIGKTDAEAAASALACQPGHKHLTDFFSDITHESASRLLLTHLKRPGILWRVTQDVTDNFVSWSSSLLFVIQYAIWRSKQSGRAFSEVHICAVDTACFPIGQFVRDLHLLRACRAHNVNADLESLYKLRTKTWYDNGEYLSQGHLNINGRSKTVSLADLMQRGLSSLYPEFDDSEGNLSWTKRVVELRDRWTSECRTSTAEVQDAMHLASYFSPVEAWKGALAILMFKNRTSNRDTDANRGPGWVETDGPAEVRRYWRAIQSIESGDSPSLSPADRLREYLGCS